MTPCEKGYHNICHLGGYVLQDKRDCSCRCHARFVWERRARFAAASLPILVVVAVFVIVVWRLLFHH